MRKVKITLGNSLLHQRIKEIPMPHELLEQLYDDSRRLGYETEEEVEYRDRKVIYNKGLLRKIKRLRSCSYNRISFTEKQANVFNLLFIDGLTIAAAAKILNVNVNAVQDVKKIIVRKIKQIIEYDFK